MLRRLRQTEKGFTLIELLIIIAVIGLLIVISMPILQQYKFRAFMSMTKSDAKNAQVAIQDWIIDNPVVAPPADGPVSGPGTLPTYNLAKVSKGVVLQVANGGDIIASHVALDGNFKINADGSIEDTLQIRH